MATTYFIADMHFGDKRVMELDHRPFATVEEMDRELIRRWNAKVKAHDKVYILGDLSAYSTDRTIEILEQLNGKKYFIRGNHDRCGGVEFESQFAWIENYAELQVEGKKVVISHYPIAHWKGQRYGTVLVYGHTHAAEDETLFRQYGEECRRRKIIFYAHNAGCMFWNYEPVSLKEMIESPWGQEMHRQMTEALKET